MMVACFSCTPDTISFRIPRISFGSQEAIIFLQKCSNFKQLKQIHGKIIRFGLSSDQLLIRKLVYLFSSYGKMNYATLLFHQIKSPDTFTWNIMIKAYTNSGSPDQALLLFKLMLCHCFQPDKFTFPFVINACVASSAINFGRVVHALAIKMGVLGDIYVQNTLMNLYFKCENTECGCKVFGKMRVRSVVSWTTMIAGLTASGQLDAARRVFEQMPSKNVVSWTAMIDAYVKYQQPLEAFELFQRMQHDNVRPNEFTVVSLIKACTEIGSLNLGKQIHDFALNNGFEIGVFLGTALIDMYSKCGSLHNARRVFDEMQIKGLATWNSMITSLGVHGLGREALGLFEQMEASNVAPDAITFVGVLSACVHLNKLEEAQRYFNVMTEHYGIMPVLEHYQCMIELYSSIFNDGKSKLAEICILVNATKSLKPNYSMVSELLVKAKLSGMDYVKKQLQEKWGIGLVRYRKGDSSSGSRPQVGFGLIFASK